MNGAHLLTNVFYIADRRARPCDGQAARLPRNARQGAGVESGEIAYPVNECTIAGNLRDMLLGITPANDARPWLSHVVPSLLVEGMTLAGS